MQITVVESGKGCWKKVEVEKGYHEVIESEKYYEKVVGSEKRTLRGTTKFLS